MKDLKSKAIDIKGKLYVLVSDRVLFFNENFPEGSITTELVSKPEDEFVVIKATVRPDSKRVFTGYSQTTWDDGYINKTSAIENAETSAVGRALGFMGIGVIESIASADDMNKSGAAPRRPAPDRETKKFDATEYQLKLESTSTTEELKAVWASFPTEAQAALSKIKDELKTKYARAGI